MKFFIAIWISMICQSLIWQHLEAKHWAVIVAGSKGYWNYRHQADACHAYHAVRDHGIPEENIILMMYDDIANHRENPFPGKLFNHPSNDLTNAVNVYEGCKVDYKKHSVTPENFLNILLGNETKLTPKVLKTTKDDRIFINFVDHGSVGYIGFPHDTLHALELIHTLETMNQQNKYKELVFYMEACESGSMFQNLLPDNLNVFITTAANTHESSWATYCPPNDYIGDSKINTCLGDLYSVNWIEDSDKTDLTKETLEQQYLKVKKETNKSHVMQFGSKTIRNEPVADFVGIKDQQSTSIKSSSFSTSESSNSKNLHSDTEVYDIPLLSQFYKYMRAKPGQRTKLAQTLINTIQVREQMDQIFLNIQQSFDKTHKLQESVEISTLNNIQCHKQMMEFVEKHCGSFTDYTRKYWKLFVYLCEKHEDIKHIHKVVIRECSNGMNFGPEQQVSLVDIE